MPTVFGHTLVALSFGRAVTRKRMPRRFWILSVACSCLPDLDVVAFAVGIPYAAFLGHRGFSHSLLFAMLVSVIVVCVAFPGIRLASACWWRWVSYFFVLTASHGFLDALTNGGLGVAFFSPFDTTRYFMPWRPLEVSPIGPAFFSEWGFEAFVSEVIWLGPLCLAMLLSKRILRRSPL